MSFTSSYKDFELNTRHEKYFIEFFREYESYILLARYLYKSQKRTKKMTINPRDCTVFIQVWVDVNSLKQGSTQGCYAVSNKSQDSSGEGSANLTTKVITGSNVCWEVVPIDPQYNGEFSINEVGAESGWAQVPQKFLQNVFTGQLIASNTVGGHVNSNIKFSYNGSNAITVNLPVTVIPVSQ